MQAKKTAPTAARGRSNVQKKAATKQIVTSTANQENKPPVVDTRTAEEIDASYKKNLALFNAAKAKFDDAFERKMEEIKTVFG